MNEHDDFERTVARSLQQRTDRVSTSVPDLDGVWAHVDRRRSRRRHVAAVGSLAVVAVGAIGFASIGRGDPDRIPAPAAAGAPDTQSAWRCTNQFDHFEDGSAAVFFATCQAVELAGDVPVFDEPDGTAPTESTAVVQVDPTVPITAPGSPAPATGSVCEATDSDDARVTVPCIETDATVTPSGPPASVAFDPAPGVDDPVYSLVPTCSQGTGQGLECALTDVEQPYTVVAEDTPASIARRYRLTIETLSSWNAWPGGSAHLLEVGDVILIPPWSAVQPPSSTVPVATGR